MDGGRGRSVRAAAVVFGLAVALGLGAGVSTARAAVETWVVHSRECPQELGTESRGCVTESALGPDGRPGPPQPGGLAARAAGRPIVVFAHGNNYKLNEAIEEGVKVRDRLESVGGLAPGSLFVVFHWPSERTRPGLIRDLNEKSRRSRVAGYHLASYLEHFPQGSRLCLMGQSDGARVVLAAMHLLSGAEMERYGREPAVSLAAGRPDLTLRAVVLEAAVGHHWLNPGEHFDQALPASEALLNLYNRRDVALMLYPYGRYTGTKSALGRSGLKPRDRGKLGPQLPKVAQYDLRGIFGPRHVLFEDALEDPAVLSLVAPYTSWAPVAAIPVWCK